MKAIRLVFFALVFFTAKSYSQVEVNPITYRDKERFITTTIGYPAPGTYTPAGKKEPVFILNPDGTGVYQYEDLSKKKINWGIECTEEGIPVFKEGFNSASYTLWYRTNDSEEWNYTQFSIHFAKKKMFIMGERVKDYEDYNDLGKNASNK
ncbi:hypothetical protein [Flavobacterium sp. KACC 22761]|uniref:hypothetical protein n=1 Tax=Flavobacterium sp. KACC 22761 TaxID=3092665 RepID=UPI002A75B4C6|nr:hypothetical protein [Flavobacterium sp. KACC 22761]WPO78821.1 hypothetical protein SCB73_00205 [Flavobacterium sp. KACC 22761]